MTESYECAAEIVAALHRRAAVEGDAPAITWIGRQGEHTGFSYKSLSAAVLDREHELALRSLGNGCVGLVASNRTDTVLTLLALLDLGLTVLMLGPSDPDARRRSIAEAAGVRHVIDHSATEDIVTVADPRADRVPDATAPAGSAAFVIPTSGSTAASKLVVQSARAVASNARALARHHRLRRGVTVLGGLPIAHVNGLHFSVLGTLLSGAHLVLPETISVFDHLDLVDRYAVQIASVVPTVLDALTEVAGPWTAPAGFRYFVSAAAPLHAQTLRRVARRFGARVIQGYGLTETTNFSTTMPVDLGDDEYERLVLDADELSVGVAVFEQEVAVLDSRGRLVPDGATGELCMRGEGIMTGYLGNPDETARALRSGWFHSGDLGRAQTVGGRTYFYLTGRIKNIAKVRGESVSLEEVERLALQVPGVRDAGCASVPDDLDGERLVLLLEAPRHLAAQVSHHLANTLPCRHRPTSVRFVRVVPRTPTGKIRRTELRHLVAEP